MTTNSGGKGTSSVQFRVEQVLQVHAKQESALYVDESHTFLTAWDKHRSVTCLLTLFLVELQAAAVEVSIRFIFGSILLQANPGGVTK